MGGRAGRTKIRNHEIGNMERETLEKGLILRDKIDLCAALHGELCDAKGDHRDVFLSFIPAEGRHRVDYALPEELVSEILSAVEGLITIWQKEFRKL